LSLAQKKRRRSRSPSPNNRKKLHTEADERKPTSEPADVDDMLASFAEEMRGIGVTLTEPAATAPAAPVKPANPYAGRVKNISNTWGASVHEQMHFAPTTAKPYHGVWGTRKLSKVREWVSLARYSVNADDGYVVASKPGEDGGYNYLVDMGEVVGYISGSKVAPGTKPEAKHLAVYVNKKGYVATAFPCTPEIF
jgi:hypothetical protein